MRREYGEIYRTLFSKHWWWQARSYILTQILNMLQLPRDSALLDFGCGDALAFPLLSNYGTVQGIETDSRLISADNPYRHSISHEPIPHPRYLEGSFDLVTALDVLEHLDDDRSMTCELYRLLAPGGYIVITVPASMALWDAHDVINEHRRRYDVRDLQALVPPNALMVDHGYLFHALFPLKWAVAKLNRRRRTPLPQHGIPRFGLNALLREYCKLEYRFGRHWKLPWGTSLYAVIQKPIRADHGDSI